MEDVLFIVDLKYIDEQNGEVECIEVYKDGSMWDVNLPRHSFVAPWDDIFKMDFVNLKGVPVNLPNVLSYLEDGGEVLVQKVVHSPSGVVVYESNTSTLEDSVEKERKEFEEWVKSHYYLSELSLDRDDGGWEDEYADSDMEMSWGVWKAAKGIEES